MKILTSCLTMVLLLVFLTAPAAAKPTAQLLENVPAQSPMIVGLEMSKVKSSHLFKEFMGFLEKSAKKDSVLAFVMSKKPFDMNQDIDSAVVAFSSAPTNPAQPPPPAMAVISGRFDIERVKKSVTEKYGKLGQRKVGKLDVFTTAGVDFGFLDSNTLIIAESGFAAPTWKAVTDKKSAASASKEIQQLIAMTDTTRGVWFAVNTKAIPAPAGAPAMDGAGIAMDLRTGLALEFNSKFAKADDAKKAKQQFDEMKQKADEDRMLEMFGAQPLVKNMNAAVRQERMLNMTTSITNAQVKTMVARVKAMNEQPPPVTDNSGTGTEPKPTGTGTKADFN